MAIAWHRIFGMALTQYFAGTAWKVDVEVELSLQQQRLDLVVLRHGRDGPEPRWPDGFGTPAEYNLTAVYHGFGVFLANNPRKSVGALSTWPGTKLHKPEYLSEPMTGYALAHLAWHRDEDRPAWVKHLRWVPRSVFKQGLRYLHQTADSTFKPVRLRQGPADED